MLKVEVTPHRLYMLHTHGTPDHAGCPDRAGFQLYAVQILPVSRLAEI